MFQLPQIISIGIYNSQKVVFNTKVSNDRIPATFELELPLEEGGMSYINETSAQILPQRLICAKPGQTRHTKFPYKCYYVHLILEEGALYDILMNAPNFLEIKHYEYYEDIFVRLCRFFTAADAAHEIILQSCILELIYTIHKETDKQVRQSNHVCGSHVIIENSLKYIKENLTQPLTLKAVAETAHLSPVHFHNCFKAAVGKTLHDYVEEQRIKKACQLLLTTDYSLTEIALECGFSSQSYFSYVFKRHMNQTPRQYMQEVYNRYNI